MKTCYKCKIEKDEAEFYVDKHKSPKGKIYISLKGRCKPCEAEYSKLSQRARRAKKREAKLAAATKEG